MRIGNLQDRGHLIPARRKAWTNWRWKIRNAISKGATDIKVAAEMTLISTPFSGAPKIDKPTVSGRVSGELVTINGHKKLFQWVETDTKA